jgi:copper chaperone CopZ
MKSLILSLIAAVAFTQFVRAEDVTVKITKVHLCCDSCVKGVDKALDGVDGVKGVADKTTRTVVLTGADTATIQKGVDALIKAGYFGECSDAGIKIDSSTGAKGEKVQTLKVEGVHLCCPKCVKAVNVALKDVPGVTTNDATKNAKVFVVTGDFNDADVFAALQKAGLTGKVAQ